MSHRQFENKIQVFLSSVDVESEKENKKKNETAKDWK